MRLLVQEEVHVERIVWFLSYLTRLAAGDVFRIL